MNARNGKIARLPRYIRNQLNERLEQSEESPQLLDWLNALEEVRQVVKDHFAGVPISRQNLSEWRQGGFQEWLARRDFCQEIQDITHFSDDLDDASPNDVLADCAATVLAARFASLLSRWNGEVDEQFEAKARILNGLCRSIVQLQRGMHRSIRENFEMEALAEEKDRKDVAGEKNERLKRIMSTLEVPRWAKIFGGGTAGQKIAEFIWAVQNDRLPESELLPTDKFECEEQSAKQAKSRKPTPKKQTVKQAGKTRVKKEANPLDTNDIATKERPKTNPPPANPVKVNQTSLPPAPDVEPEAAHSTIPEIVEAEVSPKEASSPISPLSPISPG
jgi:hypothetical protein